MKQLSSILLTLVMMLSLAACAKANEPGGTGSGSGGGSDGSNNTRAAVVDELSGEVKAQLDDGEMPAFVGLALLRRNSISTGVSSWTILELNEGQFAMIEEKSTLQIEQLSADARRTGLDLQDGKVWIMVERLLSGDESFTVYTPNCSLSIRGTVFSVSASSSGREDRTRLVVYEGTVVITAQDENGDRILDTQGNEVTYTVTRGTAEIIVANGLVTDARTGDLTDEDMILFFDGGPDGPGQIYEVLRERLPSLVISTPPSPGFVEPPPAFVEPPPDGGGSDPSASDPSEPPFDLALADIRSAAENEGFSISDDPADYVSTVVAPLSSIVVEYQRTYQNGSMYSANTVFEFRNTADADRVAESYRGQYLAVQNGRFLALIYYVPGFAEPERVNDQIEAFALLLNIDPNDAGLPYVR